jgi:proteic killer suppression protein
MIAGFKDPGAKELFETGKSRRVPAAIHRVAMRKLTYLDSAESLGDLLSPPGNRLEALKGDRNGQHSLRINEQYRICFVWRDRAPHQVEIVDYH